MRPLRTMRLQNETWLPQLVFDGTHSNDGLFAFVARLDDDDDWQDATLWPKANPNMPQAFPDGVPDWAEGMGTPKLEYLTEQAENAAI